MGLLWNRRPLTIRSLLAAAVAVVLVCAAAAWRLWLANLPTMAEAYERLRIGMPHEDVERTLGGSGRTRDDYVRWLDNRSPKRGTGTDLLNKNSHLPGIEYWYSDNGVIIVRFDSGGQVADKELLGMTVSTARQTLIRVGEWMAWRGTPRQKFIRALEWMGR
jgi:HAMP domain-containing protein